MYKRFFGGSHTVANSGSEAQPLSEWLTDRNTIAIKLTSRDITGATGLGAIFKKQFVIPLNTTGLSIYPDGNCYLLKEGQPAAGAGGLTPDFNLLLVKDGEITIRVSFTDMKSMDNYTVEAECLLSISVATNDASTTKDFWKKLFNFPGVLKVSDLRNFIAPLIKDNVRNFVAKEPIFAIHKVNRTNELTGDIMECLEPTLFDVGMRLNTVTEISFTSSEYSKEVTDAIHRENIKSFLGNVSQNAAIDSDHIPIEKAEEILLAAGNKVIVIDPRSGKDIRQYDFKEQLRSVRIQDTEDGNIILAGGKSSVYLMNRDKNNKPLAFHLPKDKYPKGGINSMALHKDCLYATHSEYGLARWNLANQMIPADILFQELTSINTTTRCASVSDDILYFVSGPNTYALKLQNKCYKPIEYVSNLNSPISAIATSPNKIFAGMESGEILYWEKDRPKKPSIILKLRDPIINIHLSNISSLPHILYSSMRYSVTARIIGQSIATSFEYNGTTLGIIDATSDIVCAIDTAGRNLIIWETSSADKPIATIDIRRFSEQPVLDICIKKKKIS
ncbi:MAG: hypothetical protein A2W23_07010 [Planctomycetes bacterium RBG_16_43_13]|nr:MAG: hypothetical protein A2W23_07010 [Planctomycetes bacterium RBG_16_43_13]